MKITKNFSLEELTKSATAKRLGVDNTPSAEIENKLRFLAVTYLQPIRDAWGEPIIVCSGYRCPAVNKAVGGVKNSDHLYGNAVDIKTVEDTPERNKELFDLIRRMFKDGQLPDFKQLIDEYNYDWIHLSFQDGRSVKLNQVLHIH